MAESGHRMAEVMTGIEMPLANAEFTIEAYLLANGTRLDAETRLLLAGVRDCLHNVAQSTRALTRHTAPGL